MKPRMVANYDWFGGGATPGKPIVTMAPETQWQRRFRLAEAKRRREEAMTEEEIAARAAKIRSFECPVCGCPVHTANKRKRACTQHHTSLLRGWERRYGDNWKLAAEQFQIEQGLRDIRRVIARVDAGKQVWF